MLCDPIFNFYLEEFQKHGEPYLKVIANCVVPTRIVLEKYKSLPSIQSLPEDKKQELWDYANEAFPDETKVFKTHFCQIVHTIGTCL